jgi:hypothetical protein
MLSDTAIPCGVPAAAVDPHYPTQSNSILVNRAGFAGGRFV